ncbi:hypothetical protein [Prosthecochloris sp. SCSIO W1101]|nr:hypothetical protein [Prosthecochloris sp. SCSIO W1101]
MPRLFFKGASMTWGELERISNAFALALQAAGLKKGEGSLCLCRILPK